MKRKRKERHVHDWRLASTGDPGEVMLYCDCGKTKLPPLTPKERAERLRISQKKYDQSPKGRANQKRKRDKYRAGIRAKLDRLREMEETKS